MVVVDGSGTPCPLYVEKTRLISRGIYVLYSLLSCRHMKPTQFVDLDIKQCLHHILNVYWENIWFESGNDWNFSLFHICESMMSSQTSKLASRFNFIIYGVLISNGIRNNEKSIFLNLIWTRVIAQILVWANKLSLGLI